jgi:hypothetical protein
MGDDDDGDGPGTGTGTGRESFFFLLTMALGRGGRAMHLALATSMPPSCLPQSSHIYIGVGNLQVSGHSDMDRSVAACHALPLPLLRSMHHILGRSIHPELDLAQ